jgi:hypothetical protein
MGDEDAAVSAIAQEESGSDIQAAVAEAQGEIQGKQQEHSAQVAEEQAQSKQEIDGLITENAAEQNQERANALNDVQAQRNEWNQEQTQLVEEAETEARETREAGIQEITDEQTQADQDATTHIEEGNAEATEEARKGEEEAQREQERGKQESESGGFFDWLASKAQSFFDGIKKAIQDAIDRARQAVRAVIEKAKQLAVAVIETARKAVVGIIKRVGDALIAIGDRVLAAFPALRDKFRDAIQNLVNKAEEAVNALADQLKEKVKAALDTLGRGLDAALGLLEQGLLAVVDGVKGVVKGAIDAAKAAVQALGMFAVIVKDVAAGPAQWIGNLRGGAEDGVKNHLWGQLQSQVTTWFKTKVQQFLGMGQAVWDLLIRGGITLEKIGGFVLQALKDAIPQTLIEILIEKLLSMIVPAAGTVLLIMEGLQAAWASISYILNAVGQFIQFLKSVRGGNSGPPFASAVAAAAVAVIDFVSNWLLARLQNKALDKITEKIRKIARKIAARLKGVMGKVGGKVKGALNTVQDAFAGRKPGADRAHAPRDTMGVDEVDLGTGVNSTNIPETSTAALDDSLDGINPSSPTANTADGNGSTSTPDQIVDEVPVSHMPTSTKGEMAGGSTTPTANMDGPTPRADGPSSTTAPGTQGTAAGKAQAPNAAAGAKNKNGGSTKDSDPGKSDRVPQNEVDANRPEGNSTSLEDKRVAQVQAELETALGERGLENDPMFDGMDPQTQGKVNTALKSDPLKSSDAQRAAQDWSQQGAGGDPREFANRYEYARSRYNQTRKAARERLEAEANAAGKQNVNVGKAAKAEADAAMTPEALDAALQSDLAKVSSDPPGSLDPLLPNASPDEVACQVQGLERVAFESPTAEAYHAVKHKAELPTELQHTGDPVVDYAPAAHDTIKTGEVVGAVRVQGDSIRVVIHKDYGDTAKVTMEAIIYVKPDGTVTLATYGKPKAR